MKKLSLLSFFAFMAVSLAAQDSVFSKFPEYDGFTKKINPTVYLPDNLWDYIDGAADAYLGFGFTDLHMAEYAKGKKITVRVEVYRHANRNDAFGIYANERFPDYHFINVGVQGYQQADVLNFFSDDYYVKIYGSSATEPVIKAMKEIALRLATNLGGNTGFPEALSLFPKEGKTDNKESFIALNFMGFSFFHSIYVSEYSLGETQFRMFYFRGESPEECSDILQKYAELAKQDKEGIVPGRIGIDDAYNGKIYLLWKGNEIWGIVDLKEPDVAERYLKMVE